MIISLKGRFLAPLPIKGAEKTTWRNAQVMLEKLRAKDHRAFLANDNVVRTYRYVFTKSEVARRAIEQIIACFGSSKLWTSAFLAHQGVDAGKTGRLPTYDQKTGIRLKMDDGSDMRVEQTNPDDGQVAWFFGHRAIEIKKHEVVVTASTERKRRIEHFPNEASGEGDFKVHVDASIIPVYYDLAKTNIDLRTTADTEASAAVVVVRKDAKEKAEIGELTVDEYVQLITAIREEKAESIEMKLQLAKILGVIVEQEADKQKEIWVHGQLRDYQRFQGDHGCGA